MTQIYKKDEFIIVQFKKGKAREFMVVNTKKADKEGFKNAHTHLKSYDMSKYIISLVRKGKINNGLSIYLLTSLERVSEDVQYQRKVRELINTKKSKGQSQNYHNKPVGLMF